MKKQKLSDLSFSDLLLLYKFMHGFEPPLICNTEEINNKITKVGRRISQMINDEIDFNN